MQFIQNHVSAWYLSFHVTLVISVFQSPVHCCVLLHWKTRTQTHSVNVRKHVKKALYACVLKEIIAGKATIDSFLLVRRDFRYNFHYIFKAIFTPTATPTLQIFFFFFIFLPIYHSGKSLANMSASTHKTNFWESSRLLQVEYGYVLRLINKAVTKTLK